MVREFLPLEERLKAYRAVRKKIEDGESARPTLLMKELRELGYALPSRQTISPWSRAETSAFSGLRIFEARPSEELSFFLGAWIGDGWADENDAGKRMLLKVRSYDFAKEFADCAAKIFGKTDSYWVRRVVDKKGRWYLVKVTSTLWYGFVSQPLAAFWETIERFPRGFLRGFFTAEGNPSVEHISEAWASPGRRGLRFQLGP